MKQNEFIDELMSYLSGLSDAEKREIILDYEEYFREGRANGRTDAEIANGLGSPFDLAQDTLEKHSIAIVPTTLPYGFETEERSGNRWFKHAWHLFKKSPIVFIVIAVLFGLYLYQVEGSAYYVIHENLANSVVTSLIIIFAFQCEHKKSIFEFDQHKNNFILLLNIICASLLWLILVVAEEYMASLIGGREFGLDLYSGEKSWAEQVFSFVFYCVAIMLCFMVSALIIINKVRFDIAYKISFRAGLLYWKQIICSMLIAFGWLLLVFIVIIIFLNVGASATNLSIEMEKIMGEGFFMTTLLMIIMSPMFLLNYTAWAAVFRDGSMKNTVNQIN